MTESETDRHSDDSEEFATDTHREIPTIDPEIEPEFVGSHSALADETCQQWVGESPDEVEQCGAEATHTIVVYHDGKVMEIASCDEHGEPDDVRIYGQRREWTGEVKA